MKRAALVSIALLMSLSASSCQSGDDSDPTPEQLEKLARCLTEKGFVVYGTSTCSGCRAQRKAFGDAWSYINYVECDPHEADSQVDRCLKLKIRKTPTWILEVNGKEIKRLESYQLLDDLARFAGCEY